jgi:hypothetical protein
MVADLDEIKNVIRNIKKHTGDIKSNIKDVVDSTAVDGSGLNPNQACSMIVDIIFDKTIYLMEKDNKTSKFYKSIVVSTVNKGREPIKNYLMSLDRDEAVDIIRKMKYVLDMIS